MKRIARSEKRVTRYVLRDMRTECYFSKYNIKYIDYKDTELLEKFLNPHGRIIGKKHTDVCSKHQRELAQAIKRARFMGLLPYVKR